MSSVILQAESLNLPTPFDAMVKGKKVELTVSDGKITIVPVKSVIEAACGMLESDGNAVDRFMERKRIEKELEDGK